MSDAPASTVAQVTSIGVRCDHPRCPVATSVCGWESRDLMTLIEEHWTRRDPETYERERALVGDLAHLDIPATTARIGAGPPDEVRALLDRIRAENPDEPLWHGIDDIADDGNGVVVRFHEGEDPALRPAGGADVACVLYGEDRQG